MKGFLVELLMALLAAILIEVGRNARLLLRIWALFEAILEHWKRVLLYALIIFALLVLSDLTPIRLGETVRVLLLGLPAQEQMVSNAWKNFNEGDFQGAIERSRAIVNMYEISAQNDQDRLTTSSADQWVPGKVGFGRIWRSMDIFDHGSLNSVALAWWIEGRSQQGLGHTCEAKDAFEAASRYTYARTWDPQGWPIRGWSPYGWFWSPPDDARQRIKTTTCQNTLR